MAKKMMIWLTLVSLLLLVGCSTTNSDSYTKKQEELTPNRNQQISYSSPEGETNILSPHEYLKRYSAVVLEGSETLQTKGDFQVSSNRDLAHLLKYDWSSDTHGTAVPITDDGYFATARHVFQGKGVNSSILYMYESPGNTSEASGETKFLLHIDTFRVVFMNSEVDFAIIKADFSTPWFLEVRETPLSQGEVIFAGGRHNDTAKGKINRYTNQINSQGERFVALDTTLPMLPGDSGSAVIDGDGLLCGVISGIFGESTIAVTLPLNRIMALIEDDRTANKSVLSTPGAAPLPR